MSHAPRSQLTQFELDIISDHSEANSDGSNFVVFWETDNADYNCFAYAVGEEGQFLTPTNMTDVNNICKMESIYITLSILDANSRTRRLIWLLSG